jgi:hypothetical protein
VTNGSARSSSLLVERTQAQDNTRDHLRSAGSVRKLMYWLEQEAGRLGSEGLHLDSGVAADRAPAHRLYMRHKLRISAHHFEREV